MEYPSSKRQKKTLQVIYQSPGKISSRYGVAIDTIEAPYILETPQAISYEVDDDTESLESSWEGKEYFDHLSNKNLTK